MKVSKLLNAMLAVMFSSSVAMAAASQTEGEPLHPPGEMSLSGFPGCFVAPPKDSCDARITCSGVGTLYGNTGADLQAATEEASMEARNELAKFYSSKQKAQQSIAKVREDSAKSTSDGGKAINSSATRLMQSVSSTSAEAVLSGVQTLSRVVDTNQMAVTIKIGVSCKSQAAAASSQAASARSASPSSSAGAPPKKGPSDGNAKGEAYKVGPGNIKDMKQEMNGADNF